MNLKDIFFSENSRQIRNFFNENQLVEVKFHSKTRDFQFRLYELLFDEIENKNSLNYFDNDLKKYYLRLLTRDGWDEFRLRDETINIFFTEDDILEELKISSYLPALDEPCFISLVLEKNKKRNFRFELIFWGREFFNEFIEKFNFTVKEQKKS